jgi:hypothetical protein
VAPLLGVQVVTIARQAAGAKDRLDRHRPALFIMHAGAGLKLRIDSIHALLQQALE